MMDEYDAVIQNQLEEGIIEEAEMAVAGTDIYTSQGSGERKCQKHQIMNHL